MGYISLCLWREAEGEGEEGLRAVMHVIANRARTWYKNEQEPYHAAVFSHAQFTSMSDPEDPRYRAFPAQDDQVYLLCQKIAAAVVSGEDCEDTTKGALYYANLEHITSGGWFSKYIVDHPETHPVTVQINRHTFFA